MEIPSPIVVGIGASAGGLAALRKFFASTPGNTGLAFVVVVHLSPEHESHLTELLQPYSEMPVTQVNETVPLEPNHVYVIPPGRNLGTIDSHLRTERMESDRKHRAPIDRFLETLANSHGRASVGVILSGTGSDGAAALKLIKEAGGLTVVQDPNEAEYDGMPQSAIATGFVDYILPLSEITAQIVRFTSTDPRVPIPKDDDDLSLDNQQTLQKIFAQVRVRTGHDFGRYKSSTALRRIRRRMQLRQLLELSDYLRVLRESAEENHALVDDLLITVTSFFRDPDVFTRLEQDVLPKIFEKKDRNDRVRLWSVGCATGEEAYSLAMLLQEFASRIDNPPQIQIFASDLHDASLLRAREGFYPEAIEAHVSPDRLKRFFTIEAGGYRVRKEVRELVVFAAHNFLKDPPFSQIDLISCRNVMIYLKRDIQEDVIQLFHYALSPDGFLMLGSSETVERSELFRLEDKKNCIYRRRSLATKEPRLPVFPVSQFRILPSIVAKPQQTGISHGVLHQRMVERYAPPSVLLDHEYNIVHLSENSGIYLQQPGGEPTFNVFKRVAEELRVELRATLHAAKEAGGRARSKPIAVNIQGQPQQIVLQARPADDPELEGYWLLIFDDLASATGEQEFAATFVTSNELAAEAELAKKRLQTVIEEYETTQEEMRAGNEELQSTNEELRSTMEELETSKEELQSMNEELQTLNQENKHKVEELSQLSGDLQNLLTATDIATLFLDRALRIMRFTPRVGELFSIRSTDRGRPLADLTNRLGYGNLFEDAQSVLARLIPIDREVRAENKRWYLTRLLPYRSADDRIDGVVITFVDVTELKEAERARLQSEEHLSQELAAIRCLHQMTVQVSAATEKDDALRSIALAIQEADRADGGCVHLVNDAGALELAAYHNLDAALIRRLRLLGPDDQTTCSVSLRTLRHAELEDTSNSRTSEVDQEIFRIAGVSAMHSVPMISNGSTIGILTTFFRNAKLFSERDGQLSAIFALQATTLLERFRSDVAIRLANEELQIINQKLESFAYVAGHDLQEPLRMIHTHTQLLLRSEGFRGDANAVRYGEVITNGVKRMEALIKGLLVYSRLVHSDAVTQPVDLHTILERELILFEEEIAQASATITFDRLPTVMGDEQQLSVVIQNLLSNALKYRNNMDAPRIHISSDCKNGFWTIRVQDNGIGFKPEHSERIFGLFKRLHSSAYVGTGLGLAICKRAIERCDGEMWAWSAGEGEGSTFSFKLREAK